MLTPFSLFVLALIVNFIAGRIKKNMARQFSYKICQARGVPEHPTPEEIEKYMPSLLIYHLPTAIILIVNIIVAIQLYNYDEN